MKEFWGPILKPFCEELQAKRFLEIGSEDGFTTTLIIDYIKELEGASLVTIDPAFRFDTSVHESSKVRFIKDLSLNALPEVGPFDIGLIDGDHNWFTVFNELKAIEKVHKDAGAKFPVLFIHDTAWPYGRRDLYYNPENIPAHERQAYKRAGMHLDSKMITEGAGFNRNSCNAVYADTEKNGVLTAVEDFVAQSSEDYVLFSLPIFFGLSVLALKETVARNSESFRVIELMCEEAKISKVLSSLERNRLEGVLHTLERKEAFSDLTSERNELVKQLADAKRAIQESDDTIRRYQNKLRYRETKQQQFSDKIATLVQNVSDLRDERGRLQEDAELAKRKLFDKKAALIIHHSTEVVSLNRMLRAIIANSLVLLDSSPMKLAVKIQRAFQKIRRGGDSLISLREEYRTLLTRLSSDLDTFERDMQSFSEETAAMMVFNGNHPDLAFTYQHDRLGSLYTRLATLDIWFSQVEPLFNRLIEMRAFRAVIALKNIKQSIQLKVRTLDATSNILNVFERYHGFKEASSTAFQGEFQQGSYSPKYRKDIDPIIVQFTPAKPENPYYWMIGETLQKEGVDFRYSVSFDEVSQILAANQHRAVIVHFHQLEPYYHDAHNDQAATGRRIQALIESMRALKRQGAYLVWTKHNPLPHDRKYAEMDIFLIRSMLNLMDHVVVLGRHAKVSLMNAFGLENSKISVVHHPSFREITGVPLEKTLLRQEFELPLDVPVFGIVGNIKPYKGIEFIIDGFKSYCERHNSDAQLVIAGPARDREYAESIRQLIDGNTNIKLWDQKLGDSEVNKLVASFDFSVYAFTNIWGSSSVVLSLSLETPVIIPRLGCLSDYVREDDHGHYYKHNDKEEFVAALEKASNEELYEHMQYMCRKFSEDKSVFQIANDFRAVYSRLIQADAGRANAA